jgi:virulence factor Mce-like protein
MTRMRTSTPRRRRRAPRSARQLAAIGAIAVTLAAVLFAVALRAPNGVPFRNDRTVYADFANVGNIQPHYQVRIGGVVVGQVLGVRRIDQISRATIQLHPWAGRLSADTTAVVRARGLLGERFVQLLPGTSKTPLAHGGVIHPAKQSYTYGIPEFLVVLDRHTRGALGRSINGLGEGLAGRGTDINTALNSAPHDASLVPPIVQAALSPAGAAARLLPALSNGIGALDRARADIAGSLTPTATTLGAILASKTALDQTLVKAPQALAVAEPGLTAGQRLLAATASLVSAARATLPPVPAALGAADRLLRTSIEPLGRATSLLRAAPPAIPPTLEMLGQLKPVLGPLQATLTNLDPLVGTAGRYGCDIANFASNWRSTLGYGDPAPNGGAMLPSGRIGPLDVFRITAVIDTSAIQGINAVNSPVTKVNPYASPCTYSPGKPYVAGLGTVTQP